MVEVALRLLAFYNVFAKINIPFSLAKNPVKLTNLNENFNQYLRKC